MTDRTATLLVCVYYRVAARDAAHVIARVRDFQRTLQLDATVIEAEVLLRCQSSFDPAAADARQASRPPSEPPGGEPMPEADATVMETYRLATAAVAPAFLAMLATAAGPLAGVLRGERHVELFASCAS